MQHPEHSDNLQDVSLIGPEQALGQLSTQCLPHHSVHLVVRYHFCGGCFWVLDGGVSIQIQQIDPYFVSILQNLSTLIFSTCRQGSTGIESIRL